MRKITLAVCCFLLCTSMLFAAGPGPRRGQNRTKHGGPNSTSTCGDNPVLTADGTANGSDFIGASTTNYYFVNLFPGHSYTVEVWDPFDAPGFFVFSMSLLQGDCATPASITDVTFFDPDMSFGNGQRISWIQSGTSEAGWQVALTNSDTNGYSYYIRLTDTTMHNPRWSTFSGFITQYGFQNNSSQDIAGTVTVTDATGPVHTLSFTVPAGQVAFKIIGPASPPADIVVPAQHAGSSSFAFVGPAGAITADSYFIGSAGIIPGQFVSHNGQH